MNITIDDFVLEHVFNHFPGEDDFDEFWWAPVLGGGEGYITLWKDGTHHHTYHNPATTIEDYFYRKGLPIPEIDDKV